MKFTLSTVALVATLLAQETLAGVVAVHPRHAKIHAAARREASEAAEAPAALAEREVVYITNTVYEVVTVGPDAPAAPTPAAVVANQKDVGADNYAATKAARISVLQHQASIALENWSKTYYQKTTLQAVAAPAPTPAPEPVKAAPAPAPEPVQEAPQVQAEAPAEPKAAVLIEQPKTGAAPSGGKRGLAYNDAGLISTLIGGQTSKASWAYNWGSTSPQIPAGIEYVPMLWGNREMDTSNWQSAANKAIASGSTHLLGFNEPDHWEQAATDPGTCAQAYKTHMQPFAGKAKLGAPAVTNGGGEMGLNYLKKFMSACSDCTIDFVPIHWYDSAQNIEYFKKHVEDARVIAGNRPIWITEFGATGDDAAQADFLKKVLPWLEAQDYVERYAYFFVDGILTKSPTVAASYLNSV